MVLKIETRASNVSIRSDDWEREREDYIHILWAHCGFWYIYGKGENCKNTQNADNTKNV